MKKFLLFMVLMTFFVTGAFAQKDSETYVGVQFNRANPDVRTPSFRFEDKTDSIGAVASLTNYVTENVGLTAELGANFNGGVNKSQLYTFMGGVTLKSKRNKLQPFAEALAGVAVQRADNEILTLDSKTDAGVAFAVGGGVDYKINDKVQLRILKADYLQTRIFGNPVNNFRFSTGFVF